LSSKRQPLAFAAEHFITTPSYGSSNRASAGRSRVL